jgi:hypothetical protein
MTKRSGSKLMAMVVVGGALFLPRAALAQNRVTVTAQLSGAEEPTVGGVPGVITGANGNATVTVDRTTQRITYRVNVFNLPTGLNASHIHVGTPGQGGPIILNFNITQNISNDFSFSGELTAADIVPRAAQGVQSFDDVMTAIASGVTYVNVHTQANPGGEIRGQLCPESAQANTFNGIATCVSRRP